MPVLVAETYRIRRQFRTGSNCGERFLGVAKKGAVVNMADCLAGLLARSSLAREFRESKKGSAGCERKYSALRPAKMAFPALKMAVAGLYPHYWAGMRWCPFSLILSWRTHAREFLESSKKPCCCPPVNSPEKLTGALHSLENVRSRAIWHCPCVDTLWLEKQGKENRR